MKVKKNVSSTAIFVWRFKGFIRQNDIITVMNSLPKKAIFGLVVSGGDTAKLSTLVRPGCICLKARASV